MQQLSIYIMLIMCTVLVVMLFYVTSTRDKKALHYIFITIIVELLIWYASVIAAGFFRDDAAMFVLLDNFTYLGAAFVPVTLLFLGMSYGKNFKGFSVKHLLVFIIPVLTIILIFTNDYHHLFYLSYSLETGYAVGPYFYVYAAYSYSCMLIGMSLLCYSAIKTSGVLSIQAILNLIGSVIPAITNLCYTIGITSFTVYSTPIAFTVTVGLYLVSMLRFDLLKVVPIATQTVVNRISDCFVVVDSKFDMLDFNLAFAQRFLSSRSTGRQRAHLNEAFEEAGLPLEQQQKIYANIKLALEKNGLCTDKLEIKSQDTTYYYTVEYTPISEKGQQPAIVILFKDVTQHVLDLQALKENQSVMLERERLASLGQMIGGIAHNLKSPILAISGGIDQMQFLIDEYRSSVGDPEVTVEDHHEIAHDMEEWQKKMKHQVSYMSDIITSVKGQAAQLNEGANDRFTIGEAVKRTKILMHHTLTKTNCTLVDTMTISPLKTLFGDINSLVQILDCVIDNATQSYGPSGGTVELLVEQVNDDVRFTIRDHGSGIAPDIQQLLFKEMITTKGKYGTGLGLYMSYSTVKGRFMGQMSFESSPGEGTAFYITIPLARN